MEPDPPALSFLGSCNFVRPTEDGSNPPSLEHLVRSLRRINAVVFACAKSRVRPYSHLEDKKLISYSNATTQLATGPPAGFDLNFRFSEIPISIVRFYVNAIAAIAEETHQNFLGSSQGYYSPVDMEFVVVPSSSQYPHLQHCHIVWAIERCAVKLQRDRTYKAFMAGIGVPTFQGIVKVGVISVKLVPVPPPGILGNSSSHQISVLRRGLKGRTALTAKSNTTYDASKSLTGLLNDQQCEYQLDFMDDHPINSIATWLAMIQGLADMAEKGRERRVSHWAVLNTDVMISLEYVPSVPVLEDITYGTLIDVIPRIVSAMIALKKMKESKVTFSTPGPPRVILGHLLIQNIVPRR